LIVFQELPFVNTGSLIKLPNYSSTSAASRQQIESHASRALKKCLITRSATDIRFAQTSIKATSSATTRCECAALGICAFTGNSAASNLERPPLDCLRNDHCANGESPLDQKQWNEELHTLFIRHLCQPDRRNEIPETG
jgi:hypothetical protein